MSTVGPNVKLSGGAAFTDSQSLNIPTGGIVAGSGPLIVGPTATPQPIRESIVNGGVIRADGLLSVEALQIVNNATSAGSLEIASGGTLELAVPNLVSGETLTVDSSGTLLVDDAAKFGDTISLAPGGSLDLQLQSGEYVTSVTTGGSALTIRSNLGIESIPLGGTYAATVNTAGGVAVSAGPGTSGAPPQRPDIMLTAPVAVTPPPTTLVVTPPPVTPPDTTPPSDVPPTTTTPPTTSPPMDVPPAGTTPPATTPPDTTPASAPSTTGTAGVGAPPSVGAPSDTTQPPVVVPTAPPASTPGRVGLIAPPSATSGSDSVTAPASAPPSAPVPPSAPPPAATSPTQPNGPVIANDGMTPTPLSPAEVSVVNLAANLHPASGGASAFFFDGSHLGSDFDTLGSAISSGQSAAATTQTITDMKQLLSAYVADPVGLAGRGISGQFVIDVVNTGLKAITIGSAPLDHAYAGALTQFFGAEQGALMGMAH